MAQWQANVAQRICNSYLAMNKYVGMLANAYKDVILPRRENECHACGALEHRRRDPDNIQSAMFKTQLSRDVWRDAFSLGIGVLSESRSRQLQSKYRT